MKGQLNPIFANAAAKADPKLLKAAQLYHRTPARAICDKHMKDEKDRALVKKLIEAKLI
jgi:hypothetical protein